MEYEKKGLKVLGDDGEWHEASGEFKETVRSIDEGVKKLDRPDREKIARIICCFAKDNTSCSECEYNTPTTLFPDCFCDIREETDKLLALIPDTEAGTNEVNIRVNEILGKVYQQHKVDIEEAKKQEREMIISELEKDFSLAPNDDSYLRLLVRDSLDYLITRKTAKERADEKFGQTLKDKEE